MKSSTLRRTTRGGAAATVIVGLGLLPAVASLALPAPAAGTITTVAGMGRFNGDNRPATSATLAVPFGTNFQTGPVLGGVIDIAGYNPAGIGVDTRGNLYIADRNNHRVRRASPGTDGTLRTGTITTVAGAGGAGGAGETGDGGTAATALLRGPRGVTVDAGGTLFIADTENNRIRAVGAVAR